MAERKALHGDGKYRAITEEDTTRRANEGEGPSPNIGTPSAYYEVDQLQCRIVSSAQSTSAGKFPEQTLIQPKILVQIQVIIQWMRH